MVAWELGGGLDHLDACTALALGLVNQGHEVDLVVKDLSLAEHALGEQAGDPRLRLWPAPVWLPALTGLPEPASHAELLFRAGYLDAGRLLGLVRAWRSLLQACAPALLLADHAPTALLAARGLPVLTGVYGSAFSVPPPQQPWPLFRDWEAVPAERIEAANRRVWMSCNHCLHALGDAPLPALSALYQCDEHLLLGWPELDPYTGLRSSEALLRWGCLPAKAPRAATAVAWRPGRQPRILGYLQAAYPGMTELLGVLRAGPGQAVVYLAGISSADADALSTACLQLHATPVDLGQGLREADLWLGHAGSGSTHAALSAGVPTVLLPMQAEQLLTARRVAATGAGRLLWPQEALANLGTAITGVAADVACRQAAQQLAARRSGDALPGVLARCAELLSAPTAR